MDDFMIVRFALDNVRPPEIALKAMEAFDRIVDGRAVGDTESVDWARYMRSRTLPSPKEDSRPVATAGRWVSGEKSNVRPAGAYHHQSGP